MGENRWLGADDWPIPGTKFVSYYTAGGTAGRPEAGRLLRDAPPAASEPDRYDYDPADPTPFLWTKNVDSGGPDDYRSVEARTDVLVYTMPPAGERMVVCGPVRALVTASSSARDTDWVARLSLVRADGYSQRLTEGWIRARTRHGDFRNEPLTPGKPETYSIDLWGTCVSVRPGERLRLALMSAAFPLLARNLNTTDPIGTATRLVIARQAVHPGTAIILPVVEAPTEIPRP
jgi:uncharacterized protein